MSDNNSQERYPTQSLSSRFFNLFKSKEQKETEFEQGKKEIDTLLNASKNAYLAVLEVKLHNTNIINQRYLRYQKVDVSELIEPSREDLDTCIDSYKAAKDLSKKIPGMLEYVKNYTIDNNDLQKYEDAKLYPKKLIREAAKRCDTIRYRVYIETPTPTPKPRKETEDRHQVDPYYMARSFARRRGGRKTMKTKRRTNRRQIKKRKTLRIRY